MAHSHSKHENYFVDQIFGIGLCGALAVCSIILYLGGETRGDNLFFISPRFQILVFIGGIALGIIVLMRAIVLWREAESAPAHNEKSAHHHHEHDHEHCDHDHGHDHDQKHGPDCDHDHHHGWAPWRYVLLLLPIACYALGLPSKTVAAKVDAVADAEARVKESLAALGSIGDAGKVPKFKGTIRNMSFIALEEAAKTEDGRNFYTGYRVTLIGQFVSTGDPSQFGLSRKKMVCCSTDAVSLKSILMVHPAWRGEQLDWASRDGEWVEVEGLVLFVKRPDRDEHVPIIVIVPDKKNPPNKLVKKVTIPKSEWFLK